jgi:hypothetical protein
VKIGKVHPDLNDFMWHKIRVMDCPDPPDSIAILWEGLGQRLGIKLFLDQVEQY